MKKALLFVLFLVTALQLDAAVGHGYIVVCRQDGQTDSIAVHGTYDISHSMTDVDGFEHDDFVTLVVTTAEGEWRYSVTDVAEVYLPELRPWDRITLTGDIALLTRGNDGRKRLVFNGKFPPKDLKDKILWKWVPSDSIYIHMAEQDVAYKTYIENEEDITADSLRALFHTIEVEKKEEPVYVYYPGRNASSYNHVKIARTQVQGKVDDSEHIAYSGDCATALATYAKDPRLSEAGITDKDIYVFDLLHHPAYFAFLTHNPRVPSVKVKSVTMVASKPISGTFEFAYGEGIKLETVGDDKNDSITLKTDFFFDDGWKHTPRIYENCQDSTAAYMVVAPQRDEKGIDFKFIFNVIDTLSLIDTTFVKSYHLAQLKPNTFYTVNAEVPDTLFSIVDLGLGDIKYAFRNVEAYFERGPVSFYGGAFGYGESNTKDSYDPGYQNQNMRWGLIDQEFTAEHDAAYQRWGGCWRLQQTLEADTLLARCQFEWREYNGVEGVLVTGPSGKRIFLPANDNCANYWAVNREYTTDDLYYYIPGGYGALGYKKIPNLGIDKDKAVPLYQDKQEFYQPGFARGVIEYSNYLKSNTPYDGSLMLLRHKYEQEVSGTDRFAIVGMVRSARPWPSESTVVHLNETGFIFGTDSATLYYDYTDSAHNKMWSDYEYTDTAGLTRDTLFSKTDWRPVDGNHLMLKDGPKSVGAYAANEQDIRVELNGSDFLGFLDKDKKYYVREYFRVYNEVTDQFDIYYASKATQLSGFFPHTGSIRWQVGDEDATLNGYIVGISRDVVGKVGFVVTDSVLNENDYALPTLQNGELLLSDPIVEGGDSGLVKNDMTFSHTITNDRLSNKRYYFVRGVFVSFSEDPETGKMDTTCVYAPEVRILHTLDTIDLQMGFKVANINVGAQYPEDRDSTYVWNSGPAVNPLITDIAGTEHDIVFRKWFGREGWCFTMPTTEQAQALKDTCEFKTPNESLIRDNRKRFYLDVKSVAGINSVKTYMPYTQGYNYDYAQYWTSQRATADANAYMMNYLGGLSNTQASNKYWVRPVLQTNCKTLDDEIMFISTDTLGRYFLPEYEERDSTEIRFYGRQLGITPAMKDKYEVIERGFVLHDFKGGTHQNTPCAIMPDGTAKDDIFNGLYYTLLTNEVRDTMRADKEYWYRAYIQVKKEGEESQYYYGKPKKITPLTISVDSIGWEVHEKTARLFSYVDGVDFVKNRKAAVVGYVVGDSANIDTGNYEQKLEYTFGENEELRNTRVSANNVKSPNYPCVMNVPIDTVYWVRAFITADGVTRYSEARQFGLDYVDLGIKDSKGQTLLWANIDVGSAYAEDYPDYYAIGEAFTKNIYEEATYEEDYIRQDEYSCERDAEGNPIYHYHPTTSTKKLIDLPVPNTSKSATYTVKFRGAEKEKYGSSGFCYGEAYWKAYSGTKNDAAYVNWGNDNPKFKNTDIYIDNTKYGNLFVEPVQEEWEALRDQCDWKPEVLFGVPGWRVSSKTNDNSIFLPLKGKRGGSHYHNCENQSQNIVDGLVWRTDTTQMHSAGFFHCADGLVKGQDSVKVASLNTSEMRIFDEPSYNDNWTLTTHGFYQGLTVRPIARYNYRITKKADKLRDDTLAWVSTDTCYYLNNRTAVALQGSYRINYPLAPGKFKLGFVVGTSQDVSLSNKLFEADTTYHNNSQYFVVVDKNNDLRSDQTYYYRFYVQIEGQAPFYADADTFHLGRHRTGAETAWQMYKANSHMTGSVEGVMAQEAAAGFKAGIIVSYNRDLTLDDADLLVGENDGDCTSQLNNYDGCRGGNISIDYTMQKDTTHYFRVFVKYAGGTLHYGDVNLFGYELLDLGLPSGKKWASINVGGNSPLNGMSTWPLGAERPGVYNNMPYGTEGKGCGGNNDVSKKNWHNVYREPVSDEAQELIDNCTWEPDTLWGAPGLRGTSKINGKSIFLRRSMQWYEYNDPADYCIENQFIRIHDNADKPGYASTYNHGHGCHGIDFERPIWESSHTLPNEGNDEILIRTDDAKVHENVDYVSFFGSLIGITQQRWLGEPYTVPNTEYTGFIVGRDTLVTHDGTDRQALTYDFKHEDVQKDSIYWYDRRNINLFMMDSVYWVRAYVKIDGNYYYGRSIKFIRQPNIITGDVEWTVGRQTAKLYGSVKGFNSQMLGDSDANGTDLQDMDELSKNARVGFIVGYRHDVTMEMNDTIPGVLDQLYYVKVNGQPQAVNGDFNLTVDYKKDTTYYYRAFVYYKDKYIYGKTGRFGLEFIDMGFGRKGQDQNENTGIYWASINVGSRYAEDVSNQFAWGDTLSRYPYTFENYIYYKSTGDDEYNNLGNEIKGSPYDVAHRKWDYTWDEGEEYGGRGQLWSMPSEEDLQMLIDSCEWKDSTSYKFVPNSNGGYYANVEGYKVTSKKNGNWIFITKERVDEWTMSGHHSGYDGPWEWTPLWTSSRAPRDRNAYGMQSGTTNRLMKYHYRYHGHYVRPLAYINVRLDNGKKLSLTTERTSWVAGVDNATIYGCILGLNDQTKATYGFLVGTTDENLYAAGDAGHDHHADVVEYTVRSNSSVNGLFSKNFPTENNRMYYFRVFAKVGDQYFYGNIKDFGIVMVDLGLTSGTKWANVNMGSWKAKDHGDYYGWGETTTKDVFTEVGYKYYDSELGHYRDLSTNISANDTTDVANKFLRGLWRMPGDSEWEELRTQCTWTRDTVAHIPGYRVSGNGNSIFLPSNYFENGDRDTNYDYSTSEEGDHNMVNHDDDITRYGYYWSSNRSASYKKAREVKFDVKTTDGAGNIYDNARWRGNAIRAVARPLYDGQEFYVRTESTDWRYDKDSVNFYAAVLNLPTGYTAGFLIGTVSDITKSQEGNTNSIADLTARPTKDGSGNYVATLKPCDLGFGNNEHVYYYRSYVKDTEGTYWMGDAKQFGFSPVAMGTEGLTWANINVDAASPEEIGLNGTPTDKYVGVDPAYAEFGSLWRTPSESEKQQLLDTDNFDWTLVTKYGTQVWKVTVKEDLDKPEEQQRFIYLTSNDPSEWGYRAIMQSNVTLDDDKQIFLRTDSTNWRAGYAGSTLYATLVGSTEVINAINEAEDGRGFVIGTTSDVTHATEGRLLSTETKYTKSAFSATMPTLPVGTYYYRAYVKYGDKYYYAPDAKEVGIDFVDLGLPSGVKWANVNVGSTVASDLGDAYAWGETTAKTTFTESNYKHHTSAGYKDIGTDISSSSYDAATAKIEGTRMPTQTEVQELLNTNYTIWTAETLNGVQGYRVSGRGAYSGNSIFLPKTNFWSATQQTNNIANAADLYVLTKTGNDEPQYGYENVVRYSGLQIRPVTSYVATTAPTDITTSQAVLNGVVNVPDISGAEVGFELSRSSAMANYEAKPVSVSANGAYSFSATELEEGNMYYYRAYVKLTVGNVTTTYRGTIKSFATKSTEGTTPTAIDLGLSVKWADRNVDANLPELDGNYYAWGDLQPQPNYTAVTYRHADGTVSSHTFNDIGKNITASQWDIATIKYAGCWRLPTQAEMNELKNSCSWTWGTKEGVPGYWVENASTHKNIFLPAAGYRSGTETRENDVNGRYWAGTTNTGDDGYAQALNFNSTGRNVGQGADYRIRYEGLTLRAVYDKNGEVDGQDIFIRTDSISYAADRTSNTLHGTMLGLNSAEDGLTQGFVVVSTDVDGNETIDSHKKFDVSQTATANGPYSLSLTDEQLQQLTVGARYWVRAYVEKNSERKYGSAIPMNDYTFFTDSVKWGLSNAGHLYAHVKGTKPATGLTVGFCYSTTSGATNAQGGLSEGKYIAATFDATHEEVFSSKIDTIKVATYYYQAYTCYEGVYHYGEVKSFGAKVVDLGLPSGVQWVDMNLGSDDEENPGDTYRWGETAPNETGDYTVSSGFHYVGGTQYDAAHVRLGGKYRIASIANIQELLDNCTWAFDVNGYRVTSKKNSNSIFIPVGEYWSSQKGSLGDENNATALSADGSNTKTILLELRNSGLLLRPTLNPAADINGEDGNAGVGVIGGPFEGNE